jgi:hypothetical protein
VLRQSPQPITILYPSAVDNLALPWAVSVIIEPVSYRKILRRGHETFDQWGQALIVSFVYAGP